MSITRCLSATFLTLYAFLTPLVNAEDGPEKPNGPLQSEDPIYDWGSIYLGEQLSHTFVLKNTGDRPVKINSVVPDCGCTIVSDKDTEKPLAPGASIELPIDVDTRSFPVGVAEQTIEVFYDDAKDPVELIMVGLTEQFVTHRPLELQANAICGGDATKQQASGFRFYPVNGEKVKFNSIRARHKLVQPRYVNYQKNVALHLRPFVPTDCLPGIKEDVLIADVEVDGEERRLHFNMSVILQSRVRVGPERGILLKLSDTAPMRTGKKKFVEAKLELTSRGPKGHKFNILDIAVEPNTDVPTNPVEVFEPKLVEVKSGTHYTLVVRVVKLPREDVRSIKTVLKLKTDDPRNPELNVPIHAQF